MLLVDALDDVGKSGGVDGEPSSLDVVVRAAGAVAEHFVAAGDRVGLVVLSDRGVQRLAAATGHRHLRQLMESLAGIKPLSDRLDSGACHAASRPVRSSCFSPALSSTAVDAAAPSRSPTRLHRAGARLPAAIRSDEQLRGRSEAIAWRIRLLEREAICVASSTPASPS